MRLLATARDRRRLEDLVEKYGDQVRTAPLDVPDEDAANAAVQAAMDAFGCLDVVVNNAGDIAPFEQLSSERFKALVARCRSLETGYFIGLINNKGCSSPALESTHHACIENQVSPAPSLSSRCRDGDQRIGPSREWSRRRSQLPRWRPPSPALDPNTSAATGIPIHVPRPPVCMGVDRSSPRAFCQIAGESASIEIGEHSCGRSHVPISGRSLRWKKVRRKSVSPQYRPRARAPMTGHLSPSIDIQAVRFSETKAAELCCPLGRS